MSANFISDQGWNPEDIRDPCGSTAKQQATWRKHGQRTWVDTSPKTRLANRHVKKGLASLLSREMQIQTTLRYPLAPTRMATLKNQKNQSWQECGEIVILCMRTGLYEGTAAMEMVWSLLKKLKRELPADPVCQGLKEPSGLPRSWPNWSPSPRCGDSPSDWWTSEENVVWTYSGVPSRLRKRGKSGRISVMTVNAPAGSATESQSWKDKYSFWVYTGGIKSSQTHGSRE